MNHPPYHLRVNKAVDRLLLVRIMRAVLTPEVKCTYYSLAGAFLEDLRLVDYMFPWVKLESIESSKETVIRQSFHKFRSDISLHNIEIGEFVNEYDAEDKPEDVAVFWLDYTNLNYPNITTFSTLLTKVPVGSIVRVTLRSEPNDTHKVLKDYLTEPMIKMVCDTTNEKFRTDFAKVIHTGHDQSCVEQPEFARTVQLMLRNAASQALDKPKSTRDFLHLHSVRYNDQTQMLSVTGIVYERSAIGGTPQTAMSKDYFAERLKNEAFVNFDWPEPAVINIPALTFKERLKLEEFLPLQEAETGAILSSALGYKIADSRKNSDEQMSQYAQYYREYPNFIKATF